MKCGKAGIRLPSFKEIAKILASVWKKEERSGRGVYTPEEYSSGELPKEFRFNVYAGLGCLAFLFIILLINILIFVFFRIWGY